MPPSPFFARIKSDVLAIVRAVPAGKVTTYASIGEHLDVMPRHVAYILSSLDPLEKIQCPWHRVVGANGALGKARRDPSGATQSELLKAEGVFAHDNSVQDCLGQVFVPAAALESGVKKQTRPADAPVSKPRKARRGGK